MFVMENHQKHINDISEIRNMMERASKFISLSGISGVSAGIIALIGASIAFWHLNAFIPNTFNSSVVESNYDIHKSIIFLFIDAFATFILAFAFAIIFTTRNSRRKNIPIWDYSSKRLLIHLIVPLIVAFFFIVALVYYQYYLFIIPSSLIFYGLSLINAGHFTFRDIKILGFLELLLGLLALVLIDWALYIWAFGFGILHIVYGSMMYFKYEK
jgi:hypothetical protein